MFTFVQYLEKAHSQQLAGINMGWLSNLLHPRRRTDTEDTFKSAHSRFTLDYYDYEHRNESTTVLDKTNQTLQSKLSINELSGLRQFGFKDSCELTHHRFDRHYEDLEQCYKGHEESNSDSARLIPITMTPISSETRPVKVKSYLTKDQITLADQLSNSLKSIQSEVITLNSELSKLLL